MQMQLNRRNVTKQLGFGLAACVTSTTKPARATEDPVQPGPLHAKSAVTGVDCHAHITDTTAPLVAGRHSEPKRDVTAEDYLVVLDAHGISYGVLTQPSFYGTDNSLTLKALARHPDRLRGTAIVAPDVTGVELQALRAGGIRGIRLNWFHREGLPDVRSAEYRNLFALARDNNLHVELYLEGEKMADVLPAIRSCGVAVVVDHFGSPEARAGVNGPGFREVLKGASAGDTWVKLSAPYRLGGAPAAPYVEALLSAAGPHQLLWGSDWPWVSHENAQTYASCLADLHSWVPDERERDVILKETPKKVFEF
jgi:predicted TIM-barrel fold metal-dependent hydrolase